MTAAGTNGNAGSNGGTVDFDDADDSGLNGDSGAKLSFKKILLVVLLIIALIALVIFGAFTYFKQGFNIFHKPDAVSKKQRNWSAAPDDIGRFIAPPPATEKQPLLLPTVELQPESPPPIIEQPPALQQPNIEQGEQPPSLKSRRLGGNVRNYEAKQQSEPPARTPSRQVKLMRSIDYTLIKGTKIPCTLESNIVSEQQGFTSCIINQDVYSGNARVLLLEKGTKVTGEYNGEVRNGERRLQIIWDRLITPYDVVVQLDSPVTDRLGASGVTGKVDNRWGTRIGSALLVSLFTDALQVLGEKSKSAQVIVDSNTSDTSQDLARQILQNNIDLPPIIYIREGEMINIYVADDIDLSSVYKAENYGR